jgi:hypothetical protein
VVDAVMKSAVETIHLRKAVDTVKVRHGSGTWTAVHEPIGNGAGDVAVLPPSTSTGPSSTIAAIRHAREAQVVVGLGVISDGLRLAPLGVLHPKSGKVLSRKVEPIRLVVVVGGRLVQA